MKREICAAVCFAMLAGCSTASKDIASTYVSPLQYQSYDCDQLNAESQRINARAIQLGARLDEAADNDKALTGVGVILFWPALFALGGTKGQEAEYARLRGEDEAIQKAMIEKKCGLMQANPPPVAPNVAESEPAKEKLTMPASGTN